MAGAQLSVDPAHQSPVVPWQRYGWAHFLNEEKHSRYCRTGLGTSCALRS